MLPGSVSGVLPGSVPGLVSGAMSGYLVSGSGSCDFVSGSVSGYLVSGSGSCDFVSGSGSCDFVSGSGSCCHVSGSGSCYLVSDVSVETRRQDVGFQKRNLTATSNWGESDTHILLSFTVVVSRPAPQLAPGLLTTCWKSSALISRKQFNSLSPSGGGAAA
jgi:hypothetical protein